MTLRNFFTWLILLAALISLALKLQLFKESDLIFTQSPDKPDAYIEKLLAIQMSPEGLPEQQLESTYLLHYPKDNSFHLDLPILTLYQPKAPPWQLNATTGLFYPDLHKIELFQHVKAHQGPGHHTVETTLFTSEATVYTEKKLIETQEPVTLLRPGLRVQSIGVRANITTGEVVLSSNAEAFYNAKRAKSATKENAT